MIATEEKLARELKLEVQQVRRKKRQTMDKGVDERSTSAKDNWKVEVSQVLSHQCPTGEILKLTQCSGINVIVSASKIQGNGSY